MRNSRRCCQVVLLFLLSACAFLSFFGPAAPAAARTDKPFAFQSPFYAVELAPVGPRFVRFSVDSLGQGKLGQNPLLRQGDGAAAGARLQVKDQRVRSTACQTSTVDWRQPGSLIFGIEGSRCGRGTWRDAVPCRCS